VNEEREISKDEFDRPRGEPSAAKFAPPTIPGPIGAPRRPAIWPDWIGGIAIFFGGMGALMAIATLAIRVIWGDKFLKNFGNEMVALNKKYQVLTDAYTILSLLAAAALLTIGILLVKRRMRVRAMAIWWSPVKIVLVLYYAWLTSEFSQANLESMIKTGMINRVQAQVSTYSNSITPIILILSGIALPVLFLILFTRAPIKSTVAGWR